LKGRGFRRAKENGRENSGLQPLREGSEVRNDIHQGLKPAAFANFNGSAEAVPFQKFCVT
jgi:hypothetical protein